MSTVAPETDRQIALYTDSVNIFVPNILEVGADKRFATYAAGSVEGTPSIIGQLCKYFPSSEYNQASPVVGRTLQDNMLTLDRYHFPSEVALQDGTIIELDTIGHPDRGEFFRVQGNSETWAGSETRRSLYARVFCKRVPPPKEIVQGGVMAGYTVIVSSVLDVTERYDVDGILDVYVVTP